MKNIDVILDALAERIKDLEFSLYCKECRIEELKKQLAEKEGETSENG